MERASREIDTDALRRGFGSGQIAFTMEDCCSGVS